MNVGPTERTARFSAGVVSGSVAAGAAAGSAAGAAGAAGAAVRPLGGALVPGGWESCLARSSVTTMSPGWTFVSGPSASDQLWPGRLQVQAGLNSVRYLKAFG